MSNEPIILEQVSKFPFDKTVEVLVEQSQQKNWNVPAVHDLQQSLAKSGKTVKPVKVIEICKPEYSGRMLELNNERIVSVMMPCRISVYQKEDGKAHIALVNMAHLAEGMPANMSEVMKTAAAEVQEIVNTVVN
jgi:uncharacterized protein (DUF302 family)